MITANDVYQIIVDDYNKPHPRVDEFIKEFLVGKFKIDKLTVRIPCRVISREMMIRTRFEGRDYFENQMKIRGFRTTYHCDDRPTAEPYFLIEIPPQGK